MTKCDGCGGSVEVACPVSEKPLCVTCKAKLVGMAIDLSCMINNLRAKLRATDKSLAQSLKRCGDE